MRRQDARRVRRHEHDRTCAVAEQHARAAIVPVEDARVDLRADDERVARRACRYHLVGDRERVHEPRAHCRDVECRAAVPDAELVLHDARGRRKDHVGRRRRHDDEVDVAGLHARGRNGFARGVRREVGRRFAIGGDVALADAGARTNPFVARVDALRERLVGEDLRREVASRSGDAASRHWAPPPRARSAPACSRPARAIFDSTSLDHFGVGLVQRMQETRDVGAAVALHDHAFQADERGAVVAARIDALLERRQRGHCGERGELASGICREFGAKEIVEHDDEAFGHLERNVADEAVADDDVRRAAIDVVALDVAVEIDRRRSSGAPPSP